MPEAAQVLLRNIPGRTVVLRHVPVKNVRGKLRRSYDSLSIPDRNNLAILELLGTIHCIMVAVRLMAKFAALKLDVLALLHHKSELTLASSAIDHQTYITSKIHAARIQDLY